MGTMQRLKRAQREAEGKARPKVTQPKGGHRTHWQFPNVIFHAHGFAEDLPRGATLNPGHLIRGPVVTFRIGGKSPART